MECTASIGPAYWHASQETCTVTEQKPDYTSWISGTGEGWVAFCDQSNHSSGFTAVVEHFLIFGNPKLEAMETAFGCYDIECFLNM